MLLRLEHGVRTLPEVLAAIDSGPIEDIDEVVDVFQDQGESSPWLGREY